MSHIIIDTSILIAIRNNNGKKIINTILEKYDDHTPWISYMTRFEYLRTCQSIKQIHEHIKEIEKFNPLSVDDDLIKWATGYYSVLSKHKRKDGAKAISARQLSDSDTIIGASAMLTGSKLITLDRNDFPAPFFTEIEEAMKLSPKSNQKVFVLQADTPFYDQEYAKLMT